jgi:hypothetical protein
LTHKGVYVIPVEVHDDEETKERGRKLWEREETETKKRNWQTPARPQHAEKRLTRSRIRSERQNLKAPKTMRQHVQNKCTSCPAKISLVGEKRNSIEKGISKRNSSS